MSYFQNIEILSESDLWRLLLGKSAVNITSQNLYLLHTLRNPYAIALLTQLSLRQSQKTAAILELGSRIFRHTLTRPQPMNSPLNVYHYLKDMAYLEQEMIRVLYVDSQLLLLRDEVIAIGSLNTAAVQIRDIIRPALLVNAYTFILAHNHPSGDPTPSKEDLQLTSSVSQMCHHLGIPLQDHIIIARDGFVSLRQQDGKCFID